MKKQFKTKEEIKKICENGLKREQKIREKNNTDIDVYFFAGYKEAINDVLWDLFQDVAFDDGKGKDWS